MLGTPDFIAPEQISDAQVRGDSRPTSTAWAVRSITFPTGGPPFEAASLYDLLQAHFSMDAQPLNLVRPEVPAELAALVAKMMAKDAGRRFQTPAEVAEALKPFFKKAGTTAKPEVSTVEQPGPGAERMQNFSTVTEPAAKAPRPPMESPDSLSSVSKTEFPDERCSGGPNPGEFPTPQLKGEVPLPVPALRSGGRPPWRSWPLVGAAGALSLVMLGIIIVIITTSGRLTIDIENGKTTAAIEEAANHKTIVPPQSSSRNPSDDTGGSSTTAASTPARTVVAASPLPPATTQSQSSKEIKNRFGIKLKLVPAGDFMMGASADDRQASNDEKPQRRVRITQPFYLGETEITRGQYRGVTGQGPSHFKGSDDLPVETVSWLNAVMFCNALSAKEGLPAFYLVDGLKVEVSDWKGTGYRLPTEAEWEYACRAKTSFRYSFGNDPSGLESYFPWSGPKAEATTHPAGQKYANVFGL